MKFTAHGKLGRRRVAVTWQDGAVAGDPVACAIIRGISKGMEGYPVGPPAGPYTEHNHLTDPVSAYFLIEDCFHIEKVEGEAPTWPAEDTRTA